MRFITITWPIVALFAVAVGAVVFLLTKSIITPGQMAGIVPVIAGAWLAPSPIRVNGQGKTGLTQPPPSGKP